MSKISNIIQREYLTRVRKKSFIVMTILGPILFAAMIIAPAWISTLDSSDERKVAVVDSSGIFDYTKILREVTLQNTHNLKLEIFRLNRESGDYAYLFKELADRLDAVVLQRDENIAENIKITLKGTLETLKKNEILSEEQFETIYNRHAEYYDALLVEFESIKGRIPDDDKTKFTYVDISLEQIKHALKDNIYFAVVYIPKNILSTQQIQIYSTKAVSMNLRSYICSNIERAVENQKMIEVGISQEDMKRIKTKINAQTIKLTEEGEEKVSRPEYAMIIGYVSGFLIYFAIFMFGALVMRGVIEEKSSRIVEVILSSVRPFQLLIGKIVGVGLVGITQFALWIVLSIAIVTAAGKFLMPSSSDIVKQQAQAQELVSSGAMQNVQALSDDEEPDITVIFKSLSVINFPLIIGMFIFYFIGGFLLYGALFAAVGSAVDNEADTQQFMMPITVPLIIALFVMINAMQNPEGSVAYWFSIIPFTSPVVMMVRLPYGVPVIDIVISMVLLVATFIFTTWLAAKIYKTGILMYGSKVTWKEIWKWIKHN